MWRYRCDSCGTTSLPVVTRAEAIAERDRHRRQIHGGHVPDGERLQRYPHQGPPASIRPWVILAILIAVLLLQLTARH